MTTGKATHPSAADADRRRLRRVYIRVSVVQGLALTALWLLQSCYGA